MCLGDHLAVKRGDITESEALEGCYEDRDLITAFWAAA